jgi:hypothetical protein
MRAAAPSGNVAPAATSACMSFPWAGWWTSFQPVRAQRRCRAMDEWCGADIEVARQRCLDLGKPAARLARPADPHDGSLNARRGRA